MSVSGAVAKLNDAKKTLAGDWARTRESWRDKVAADFEEEFLVPLEQDVNSAVRVMTTMATLLKQLQRDCT